MPAKKGDAKPASSAKKAAAPSKGVAKAPAKAAAKHAPAKAVAKAAAKKGAAKGPAKAVAKKGAKAAAKAGVKGPVKATKKAPAKKALAKGAAKAAAKKGAKGAAKKGAKKAAAKKGAVKVAAAAKGAAKAVAKGAKPAVKKTIKKRRPNQNTIPKSQRTGNPARGPFLNKKKMVSLLLRRKRIAAKNALDAQRRAVLRERFETRKKLKESGKKKEKKSAEKTPLTKEQRAEKRKQLGPWKIINRRKVYPKILRPSTRLTSKGTVWTPHVYKKPPGFNALKIRKGKLNAVHCAIKAKNMIGGGIRKRNLHKIWTKVQFRRPKSQRLPKNPQYPRRSIPRRTRLDQFSTLKHPLTTETAMKKLDDENTLVFIVDMRANKHKIRSAVQKMYDIKPLSIRTVVTPLAEKKAFVRLHPDNDALDVANKIGMI